jgi:hypothetical protein
MNAENRVLVKRAVRPDTAAGWLSSAKAVRSATGGAGSTFAPISQQLGQLGKDTDNLDAAQAIVT